MIASFAPMAYADDTAVSATPGTLTLNASYSQLIIVATVNLYVKLGDNTVTVTAGHGMYIPAGASYILSYNAGGAAFTTLAYVASGVGTMNITYGTGA